MYHIILLLEGHVNLCNLLVYVGMTLFEMPYAKERKTIATKSSSFYFSPVVQNYFFFYREADSDHSLTLGKQSN